MTDENLSGRALKRDRAEVDLVLKRQAANVLMQDAQRKMGKLAEVEEERDAAKRRALHRKARLAAMDRGMEKIANGTLTSSENIVADESLKSVGDFLNFAS